MNTGFGGVAETLSLDLGGRRLQVVLERRGPATGAPTWLSLPRFQGQCLESCFYTDPMKTNDHNECPVYATSLQR